MTKHTWWYDTHDFTVSSSYHPLASDKLSLDDKGSTMSSLLLDIHTGPGSGAAVESVSATASALEEVERQNVIDQDDDHDPDEVGSPAICFFK